MKRIGYIYEKICDIENIRTAIKKSSLGKRNKKYVRKILENIDYYAEKIKEMLEENKYAPSPYTVKTIKDGSSNKERTIYKPRYYPDQIIHWALMLQISPIMMKGMYIYTCGSVPGRGTSYGQKMLRKWLDKDYKGTKYCLKMDISKFYPSVNNQILKYTLRKHIKDSRCLHLLDLIIDSNINGLPIGNYTSQWLSNFLLQDLDHYIKERLGIKYYMRYVDDLVLLGGNKRKLHKTKRDIDKYLLDNLLLTIKKDWQIFPIKMRAIDFLGLRFFREKTILRKRNALRMKRRIKKINKKPILLLKDAQAIISYWGWIKRCNSYNFYNRHIKTKVSIKLSKEVISKYGKEICRTS
jgi:RNA-directed DNA polymerase